MIEPARRIRWVNIREVWARRGLLLTLTARHIQVRYAQSVIGVGWAVVQPLVTMLVFTVIFGRFARVPSDGKPYQLFSLAALIPWTYFATAMTGASTSLSNSPSMITKVYFPRLVLPFSQVAAPLVDLAVGIALLLAMLFSFGVTPSLSSLVVVPLLVVAMMLTATGVGSAFAALDAQYRDVKHVLPFLLQIWMFASPVVYPMSVVPERYRQWYSLNPMAGIIGAFRSVMLGSSVVDWRLVGVSLIASAVVCVAGTTYFRHRERMFADVV